MAGRIVLSVGFFMHTSSQAHGETWGCTPEQKAKLDELHLRKIDLADESLILNVGGYIGESTLRELAYTIATGRLGGVQRYARLSSAVRFLTLT